MPCRVIYDGTRVSAIICERGRRTKTCAYCGRPSDKLCDGPGTKRGQTCDVPLCNVHAAHVDGQDLDFCRQHAHLVNQQSTLDIHSGAQ